MDHYRVYGNPIKQSKSPYIHQSFAKNEGIVIEYQSELAEIGEFTEKVKQFIALNGKGANVTAPFKEDALRLCDNLTDRARLAGAVNTLTFKEGQIFGDNTDGIGLVQDLLRNQVVLKNSRILLLGAGGAAKGVILPLLEQQPSAIVIANRTVSKAEDLCHQFSFDSHSSILSASSFEETVNSEFDVIINATSASLTGNIPPIPTSIINPKLVCYDMVYGKELTPFLIWSKRHGAEQLIDGLGMLVGQAAESFSVWNGVKPEVETIINDLRKSIKAE